MAQLTERVQVLMTPAMREALESRARDEETSVAAVIRGFVNDGLSGAPTAERLEALKRLFGMDLPVADWEQMEAEIGQGRIGE